MYVRVKREVFVGHSKVVETKSGLYYAVIGGFCTKLYQSLDDLIASHPRLSQARQLL
jgi:hypothetical protein